MLVEILAEVQSLLFSAIVKQSLGRLHLTLP